MVQSSRHGRFDNPKMPCDRVFICYRRQDGGEYAEWFYDLLQQSVGKSTSDSTSQIHVFYDKMAPGVEDWQKHLQPNLESAGALLLICTPGLATDLSRPGKPDYAYKEIKWWLKHRTSPPIVVDPTGEGDRWLPAQVTKRWPHLNRIEFDSDLVRKSADRDPAVTSRLIQRIRESIHTGELITGQDRLARETILRKRSYAALAVAVSASALLTWSTIVANTAEKKASDARDAMSEATAFLTEIFRQADPDEHYGNKLTVEQLLSVGAAKLDSEVANPATRIELLQSIGSAHIGLGMPNRALELLQQAVTEATTLDLDFEDRSRLVFTLGEAHLYAGDYETAKSRLEEARKIMSSTADAKTLEGSILVALSDVEQWSPDGDTELSRRFLEQALKIDSKEGNRLAVARDLNRLGYLEYGLGEFTAAGKHLLRAVQIAREEQAPLFIGRYENDLASILYQDGKIADAEAAYRQSLAAMRDVFGLDSGAVGGIENNLARILIERNETSEAMELLTHAERVQTAAFGAEHYELGFTLNNLGYLQSTSNPTLGRETLIQAAEISAKEGLPILPQTLTHIAETFLKEDDLLDAEAYLSKAKAAFDAQNVSDGWRFGIYQSAMSEVRILQCFYSEAERLLEESGVSFNHRWGTENPFTRARANREGLMAQRRSENRQC